MNLRLNEPPRILEGKIFTISNILSGLRAFLLPPFIYYFKKYTETGYDPYYFYLLIGICVIVVLTDYFDGFFARLLNEETVIGRYLDPIADKVVTIGGLSTISYFQNFQIWVVVLFVIREIVGTFVGTFLFFKRGIQGKPNFWGKLGVGVVAVIVLLYISLPLIHKQNPESIFVQYANLTGPFLIGVQLIGSYVYLRNYWGILFHPERNHSDLIEELKAKSAQRGT